MSCYLENEAQNHIRIMDAKKYDYQHQCVNCGCGFDSGFGVKISDEKFCNDCVKQFEHFAFYQRHGVTDPEIFRLEQEQTTIL